MVPTKERNHQSLYLDVNGEGILLDCGEGTQRQIQHTKYSLHKIKKILISHWHADHTAGLLGLFQTIGAFSEGEKTIKLFGPKGSKKYVQHLLQSCVFDNHLDVEVTELDSKKLKTFYENDKYALDFINLDHSTPTIGFKFRKKSQFKVKKAQLEKLGIPEGPLLKDLQKGKDITFNGKKIKVEDVTSKTEERSIAFVFDTKICDACFELAEDANYLVSEAVYAKALEKKAEEYKHMTSNQAAQIASVSGVETLYLTHFSQRYKTLDELEQDAKDIFPNTICAFDFLKVKLNF